MKNHRIEALIVAAGLSLLGLFLFLGLSQVARPDRAVSVRGLAEREVPADHVIWPITYKTTGNDLQALYADIEHATSSIRSFLTTNKIPAADISVSAPKILDLKADRYNNNPAADRYNVRTVVTVSTSRVAMVQELMPRMGELMEQGIAVSESDYDTTVEYAFTQLNAIKPEMIEEATRAARKAAEKFAADSQSELGEIISASQGLFTIEDRDPYNPQVKRIRVVTSVNYALK